jgi:hypothetical protein
MNVEIKEKVEQFVLRTHQSFELKDELNSLVWQAAKFVATQKNRLVKDSEQYPNPVKDTWVNGTWELKGGTHITCNFYTGGGEYGDYYIDVLLPLIYDEQARTKLFNDTSAILEAKEEAAATKRAEEAKLFEANMEQIQLMQLQQLALELGYELVKKV